jgi:hypothetical protein
LGSHINLEAEYTFAYAKYYSLRKPDLSPVFEESNTIIPKR